MSEHTSEPRPPSWLKPMNKVMMAVQRLGIPTGPAMVLTVPGRKSGKLRSTPMTPFDHEGGLYTVAGYPGADWAANARAAGAGTLTRGRRSRKVRIVELPPDQSRPVLRAFAAHPTNSSHWQGAWRCFGSIPPSRGDRKPARRPDGSRCLRNRYGPAA